MADDILVELSKEQIKELSSQYKIQQTKAPYIYSHLITALAWQEKGKGKKFMSVYAPDGDFSDGTFITIGNFPTKIVILFSLDDSLKRLERALKQTTLFDNDKRIFFFCVEEKFLSIIDQAMEAKGIKQSSKDSTNLWNLEHSKALTTEFNVPSEFVLKPLSTADAVLINDEWPHKGDGTVAYIQMLITMGGGYGLYTINNDALVAWILKTPLGQLGVLQVLEQYKRKGLASVLIGKLGKEIASDECDVNGTIITGNISSEKLFTKNGFSSKCLCYYMFYARSN